MCMICKDVLVGFRIVHKEDSCPLSRSLYCNICAKHGHNRSTCTNAPSQKIQQSVFIVENDEPIVNRRVLEIKDGDCVIREYLKNHGFTDTIKRKDLRGILNEYALRQDMKIRYR